ncbi:MAG: type II secretion system F family protein [Christensenellaceae bacterium]
MSVFRYTARDARGKTVKGDLSADTLTDFYAALRAQQLYVLNYKEVAEKQEAQQKYHKMKVKELIVFCRKMGTMMGSGLSMTGAFDVLYKTAESPAQRDLLLSVYEDIQRGMPLSQALRQKGRSFPPFLVNMVESGETSGNLDQMFLTLAEHYENENKILNKIKSATTYPVILLIVSVVIIILLFTFVLPRMMSMFEGAEIPALTQIVMSISDFLTKNWIFVILVFGAIVVFFMNIKHIPPLKYIWDMAKVRMPVIGKLNRVIYSGRFARSMSLLYASGISMLASLRLSSNILNNSYIDKLFVGLVQDVSVGETLSSSIEKLGVFDELLPSMIRIGEEAGSLDTILASISDFYDLESENAIGKMISIIEPVMLVVLAGIILVVIVSVMLPIYSMYSSML